MPRIVIKKSVTTEKSFKNQDKHIWTFIVAHDAHKDEIKDEIEKLFGVKVAHVNTLLQQPKERKLKGSRIHTRRKTTKIARVSLVDKTKKIDMTKAIK